MWKAEKAKVQDAQHIKEELDKARFEMGAANRIRDLAKMSELQYGKIPELENN